MMRLDRQAPAGARGMPARMGALISALISALMPVPVLLPVLLAGALAAAGLAAWLAPDLAPDPPMLAGLTMGAAGWAAWATLRSRSLLRKASDQLDGLREGLWPAAPGLAQPDPPESIWLGHLAQLPRDAEFAHKDPRGSLWPTQAIRAASRMADDTWRWPEGALELQPLMQSMHRLVKRLCATSLAQAAQVQALRQQAHADPLTGLPHRRHFLSRLEPALTATEGPSKAGLLLLRMAELQGMNRRIGHEACDHVLQTLGETLRVYEERVDGCLAGRLNGTDFALWLPAGELALETGQAVLAVMFNLLQRIDPSAQLFGCALELDRPLALGPTLAAADQALARAELAPPFSIEATIVAETTHPSAGESEWRRALDFALTEGHVALGRYAVRAADGRLDHLDCPLRVQMTSGGAMQPAAQWLALASRSRLLPRFDEMAISLALQAIADDGIPRCVNVSLASLRSVGFISAVDELLRGHALAAGRLWLDLPERLLLSGGLAWRGPVRAWRAAGVRIGLEHAGEAVHLLARLVEPCLDYLRVDARFVVTVAQDGEARRFVQSLVGLARAMELKIYAEGVASSAVLQVLWELGFDGATGPAVMPG